MKIKNEDLLLEEYKLLSSHYFHEDTAFKKTIVLFTTISTTLLGVIGSDLLQIESKLENTLCIIGILLAITWIISMVRIRETRNYIERRIKLIEEYYHTHIEENDFLIFDIRTYVNWDSHNKKPNVFNWFYVIPYNTFKQIPASICYMILPLCFFIIWSWILFSSLTQTI